VFHITSNRQYLLEYVSWCARKYTTLNLEAVDKFSQKSSVHNTPHSLGFFLGNSPRKLGIRKRPLFWASGLCSLKQADEKLEILLCSYSVSQSPRVADPSDPHSCFHIHLALHTFFSIVSEKKKIIFGMEFHLNINRFFQNPITKFRGQDIAR
jgi:hypothetical protein